MNNDNLFEIEWEKTIQTLADKNASFKELEYFLNLGREYSQLYNNKNVPKVVMVGQSFPEEIIRAMDLEYCYIQGGSFEITLYEGVNLPKDADDVARSIVGTLKSDSLNLSTEDVILVPLYNDNMKKLKALLGDMATVICYEVPADKNDPLLQKRFAYEIERVVGELKKHFKKRLSLKLLRKQCEISKKIAESFLKFEASCKDSELSDSAFLFVVNSYKWSKNKEEWNNHLDSLTAEINKMSDSDVCNYPEILFFGSPIYAPNYKVLFVIEEMKLKIHTIIHPDIEHIKIALKMDCKSAAVNYLAMKYLESDISPAYINNSVMTDLVMDALKSDRIKGIVAHILKGQIEYDYELKNIERLTVNYEIPMNRVETIYNYQDIEQLRLRLEAFSEIMGTRSLYRAKNS